MDTRLSKKSLVSKYYSIALSISLWQPAPMRCDVVGECLAADVIVTTCRGPSTAPDHALRA